MPEYFVFFSDKFRRSLFSFLQFLGHLLKTFFQTPISVVLKEVSVLFCGRTRHKSKTKVFSKKSVKIFWLGKDWKKKNFETLFLQKGSGTFSSIFCGLCLLNSFQLLSNQWKVINSFTSNFPVFFSAEFWWIFFRFLCELRRILGLFFSKDYNSKPSKGICTLVS